ncbi:MAG TPA: endopeptidase La, partial [Desulfovibrio sp.]|nr:endopeptidase La [Desulfovibrio sp.]
MKKKKSPIKPLKLNKKDKAEDQKKEHQEPTSDAGNDQGLNKPPVSPLNVLHDAADLLDDAGTIPEDARVDIPTTLPVLAVRDIVVFNYMILPLFVGREKSVNAVEAAMTSN